MKTMKKNQSNVPWRLPLAVLLFSALPALAGSLYGPSPCCGGSGPGGNGGGNPCDSMPPTIGK